MIISISNLEICDIEKIKGESSVEGYNMINRLIADYHSGENRFDKEGEKLIGFVSDNTIVAICGINIEPTAIKLGRIRRLFVLKNYRRHGIGTELVKHLINYAERYFEGVVVNTGNLQIDGFYKSLGFIPADNKSYSHIYRFIKK